MFQHHEIQEDVLRRFAELKPEIVRSVELAYVVKIDSSTLFQGLHKNFLMVVVDGDHIEEALSERKTWLTKLIYECLAAPSAVVPIISCNSVRAKSHMDSVRNNGSEGVVGQPIIDYRDFEKISLPAKELLRRSIVDSEACFRVNPYSVHVAAVRGMFFGRTQEVRHLQKEQGHFFVVGPRRIGKTSLVSKLVETINSEPQYSRRIEMGGLIIDRRAIYVDVSILGEGMSKTIWWTMFDEFGISINRWKAYSRKRSSRRNQPVQDPAFALQNLIDSARGNLTIVLDEMDGWIQREAGLGWPTIERLRALTDGGRARLILVGYELLRAALQNDRFPLYGRGTTIALGPIDRRSLNELVTKPLSDFGISIQSEDTLTKIWNDTGGMPHVVQDVCNILLTDCLKEKIKVIDSQHVSRAFRKSQRYDEFIHGVINCPFPLAEAIAGIIALENKHTVEKTTIKGTLEEFGYEFDRDEFELAFDYLSLRYAIAGDGDFRAWRMVNSRQREYLCHYIKSAGVENWLATLIKKHNHGSWKRYYENVL